MAPEPNRQAPGIAGFGLGCGALLLVALLYLAGVGPAALLSTRLGYPRWLTLVYLPVTGTVERVPILTTPYLWYVELWTGPPVDTS